VPSAGFSDVPGNNSHLRSIDCVVWWEVASRAATYNPGGGVTREQMASFLVRAVTKAGGSLPDGSRDAFGDDNGSTHELSINRLAAAGIVTGTATGYDPKGPVNRAQMATFLVRALKHVTAENPTASRDWFLDDAAFGVHQDNINIAASVGLAGGTGTGTYSPALTVRRDQMATFLARLLAYYVERGATPPA